MTNVIGPSQLLKMTLSSFIAMVSTLLGSIFVGVSLQSYCHQLLCKRWFPASSDKPRMAVSFAILKLFHLLLFESKVSAYEFYNMLMCLSDNTGLGDTKVHHNP